MSRHPCFPARDLWFSCLVALAPIGSPALAQSLATRQVQAPAGAFEAVLAAAGEGRLRFDNPANGPGFDGAAHDKYGSSVVVSGDRMFVGVPRDQRTQTPLQQGAVYVYGRQGSGWSQLQKLTVSSSDSYSCFGASLALDRDSLVVGSPGFDRAAERPAKARASMPLKQLRTFSGKIVTRGPSCRSRAFQ